jgi:Wax ester synthase/diacylglycerol acyltransferase catalytic domain
MRGNSLFTWTDVGLAVFHPTSHFAAGRPLPQMNLHAPSQSCTRNETKIGLNLDLARVRETLERRLVPIMRFRQRVKEPLFRVGLPHWEIDPHFDLDAHLSRITLPPPGDRTALQKLAGELMSTPLDFSRPLWHYHLVEHYGSGSALIARLRHCIADGLALVQVLLSMTDTVPDAPWPEPAQEVQRRTSLLTSILTPVIDAVGGTLDLTQVLLDQGLETLAHPSRVVDAALLGASGTIALSKLLLGDPETKIADFHAEFGSMKERVEPVASRQRKPGVRRRASAKAVTPARVRRKKRHLA